MNRPSLVSLLGRQTIAEQRMFWRNPSSSGFTIAFPVMFLVIFSLTSGNSELALPGIGVVHFGSYYLAGIIVMAVLSANFMSLSISLAIRRDEGVLKRKRSTPLPTAALFGGLVLSQTIVSFVMLAATATLSIAFFHVPFPRHPIELLVVVLAGSACFAALGVAMTRAIPNQDAAPAIVNVLSLPILFLSGVFFPIDTSWVRAASRVLPVAPLRDLIFDSFAPPVRACERVSGCAAPISHSAGPHLADLAIVLAWFAFGLIVSLTTFRWVKKGE